MKFILNKLKSINKINIITAIQFILTILLLCISIKGSILWACIAVAILRVDIENILKHNK